MSNHNSTQLHVMSKHHRRSLESVANTSFWGSQTARTDRGLPLKRYLLEETQSIDFETPSLIMTAGDCSSLMEGAATPVGEPRVNESYAGASPPRDSVDKSRSPQFSDAQGKVGGELLRPSQFFWSAPAPLTSPEGLPLHPGQNTSSAPSWPSWEPESVLPQAAAIESAQADLIDALADFSPYEVQQLRNFCVTTPENFPEMAVALELQDNRKIQLISSRPNEQ